MHSTRADIYKHPNVCAYCHPVGLCFSLWWLLFPCFRDKTQTARRTTTLVVPCPVLRAQMDPILIAVLNLTPGKFLLQEEALGGLHTLIISRYRKVGPFMGQCQCLWPTLSWSCCWGGRCTADSSLEVKGQQPNGWQSKRQTQGQHVGRAKTKVHVLSPLRAPPPPKECFLFWAKDLTSLALVLPHAQRRMAPAALAHILGHRRLSLYSFTLFEIVWLCSVWELSKR